MHTATGADEVRLLRAEDRHAWYASLARLAPSKHNSQPWRFAVTAEALDVWADPSRRMQASDPLGRELVLSCGAAVETAVVAARATGMALSVTAWPQGPSGPVARLVESGRVVPTAEDRARLDAVRARRTDRGPLDAGPLPAALPFLLQDVAAAHGCELRLVRSEGEVRALSRLVEQADRLLARMPEAVQELQDWVRRPGDARDDGVPATASRGPSSSYTAPFVQRDFSAPQVDPAHEREGADDPLVAVLCTPGDTPLHWLEGGRALMAVLLELTAAGGAASFLNQPLEAPGLRDVLTGELALAGHPQAVLRMGAGGDVPVVPRLDLAQVRLPGPPG